MLRLSSSGSSPKEGSETPRGEYVISFVPRIVIQDLNDIGNWKSRASAIEKLQKALKEVEDKSALVSSLNTFVGFLMTLVADPNFKIAVASIDILGDLVKKVGKDIGPQLKKIMPNLVEKFSDGKSVVRSATVRALKLLILATSSQQVLELISVQGLHHSNPAVREEAVNATIMIMMQHRYPAPDWAALMHNLCLAMVDSKDRVRATALEAIAVLHYSLGSSAFQDLIKGSTLSSEDRKKVEERLKSATNLPTITNEGIVQHVEGVLPASSSTHAASNTSSSSDLSSPAVGSRRLAAGRLPWENSLLNQVSGSNVSGSIDSHSSTFESRIARASSDGGAGNGALESWGRTGSSRQSPGGSSPDDPANAKASILVQGVSTGASKGPSSESAVKGIASLRPLPNFRPLSDEKSPSSHFPPAPSSPSPSPCPTRAPAANAPPPKPSVLLPHSNDSSPASSAAESPSLSSYGVPPKPPTYLYNNNSKVVRDGADGSPSYAQRYQQQQHQQQHQQPFAARLSILASPQANTLLAGGSSTFPPDPPRSHSSTQMHPPPSPGPAVWAKAQEDDALRRDLESPSKSSLLEALKKRQSEKRAASSQQSERPPPGQEGSLPFPPSSAGSSNLKGFFGFGEPAFASPSSSSSHLPRLGHGSGSFSRPPNGLYPPEKEDSLMVTQRTSSSTVALSALAASRRAASGNTPTSGSAHPRLEHLSSFESSSSSSPTQHRNVTGPASAPMDPGPSPSHAAARSRPPVSGGRSNHHELTSVGSGSTSSPTYSQPPVPPSPSRSSAFAAGNSMPTGVANTKPVDELSFADLNPLPEPDRSSKQALAALLAANLADRKELDWQGQYEALNISRRLLKHNPEIIKAMLHDLVKATVPTIDALRSFTSKVTMILYQELFKLLGKLMDKELDDVVPPLLKKAGEVSTAGRENFLTLEADRTLAEMCRYVSESRAAASLIACAAHKAPTVRARVACHLDALVESLVGASSSGPGTLKGNASMLDRLLKAINGFLNEGAIETRTYGKRLVWNLKQLVGRAEFDKLVAVGLPAPAQKKVMDVLEGMNGPPPAPRPASLPPAPPAPTQGLTRVPSRGSQPPPSPNGGGLTPSSRLSQQSFSGPGAIGRTGSGQVQGGVTSDRNTSSISAPVGAHSTGGSGQAPVRRKTPPDRDSKTMNGPSSSASARIESRGSRGPLGSGSGSKPFGLDEQEALSKALLSLGGKDFRDRIEGLKALEAIGPSLANAPENTLVPTLDTLTVRLSDANAKVSIQALESAGHLFCHLGDRTAVGINTLVPALASCLGSTNDKVRQEAVYASDRLVESVDPALLVQNFAHCVSNGGLRGKALLVDKLERIIDSLNATRPQMVVKYALPAAVAMTKQDDGGRSGGPELRAASNQMWVALARAMGRQNLIDHCVTLGAQIQQRIIDATS